MARHRKSAKKDTESENELAIAMMLMAKVITKFSGASNQPNPPKVKKGGKKPAPKGETKQNQGVKTLGGNKLSHNPSEKNTKPLSTNNGKGVKR